MLGESRMDKSKSLAVAVLFLGRVLFAQTSAPSGSQDALQLQRTRERFVKERGATTFYPADKFDLSGLPAYQPQEKVSGTLRIWGNNYLADSGLADVWEAEFRKFHPDVRIEWNLKSAATAVGALWSGAADIGITGRGVLWAPRSSFPRQFTYDSTEIVPTTGSYNVAGWSNALGIFVHKENPITRLSFSQLDESLVIGFSLWTKIPSALLHPAPLYEPVVGTISVMS